MSSTQRYWCHICNAETNVYLAPDPTCHSCRERFVEELQEEPFSDFQTPDFFSNRSRPSSTRSINLGRMDMLGSYPESTFPNNQNTDSFEDLNSSSLFRILPSEVQDLFFTPPAERPHFPFNAFHNPISSLLSQQELLDQRDSNEENDVMPGSLPLDPPLVDGDLDEFQGLYINQTEENNTSSSTDSRRIFTNLIDMLSSVTMSSLDSIVGSPDDYAYSQNALDDIVSRLMGQPADVSATNPPTPDHIIDTLVKRPLTDEEKSQELDCAVCKDQLESEVIELPCDHIFHDECIKPWLKLNCTCPVCRYSVLNEKKRE